MEDASPPPVDVASLTARMARGEESAYRQFYECYFDRLLRYLLVVAGGHEEQAREALQSTLLRVARHARRFDSEAVLWSWLTVLARTALIDEQRKQSRYRGLLDRFLSRHRVETAPSVDDADRRLAELLERQLTALPQEERELLERKYFEHKSVAEIAAALASSEKAVESRLGRVRRKLKEMVLKELHP